MLVVYNFQGKTVWITGASSGIGESLAKALSVRGATIILSSRNVSELERVKRSLSYSDKHLVLPLDLADQTNFPSLVDEAVNLTGKIDMLINNGGVSQRSLAKETDIVVDRQIMEIDYFGTIALTKAVLPHMIQRRDGRIVSVSSIAGKVGAKRRSAYCGAKHALVGFMDALRAEIYEYGIKVHIVCPGFVRTNVSKNALTADLNPLGKMEDTIKNGMSADKFAQQLLKAIEKDKDEVVIAQGMARLIYHIHRFFPNISHKLVARAEAR